MVRKVGMGKCQLLIWHLLYNVEKVSNRKNKQSLSPECNSDRRHCRRPAKKELDYEWGFIALRRALPPRALRNIDIEKEKSHWRRRSLDPDQMRFYMSQLYMAPQKAFLRLRWHCLLLLLPSHQPHGLYRDFE